MRTSFARQLRVQVGGRAARRSVAVLALLGIACLGAAALGAAAAPREVAIAHPGPRRAATGFAPTASSPRSLLQPVREEASSVLPEASQAPAHSCAVVVVSAHGPDERPFAGLEVALLRGAQRVRVARTDEREGRARFSGLPAGRYHVAVCEGQDLRGLVAASSMGAGAWFRLGDGDHRELRVDLSVPAGCFGTAIGPDGRGLSDARVRAQPLDARRSSGWQETRTDAYGGFAFERLAPGPYRLRVDGVAATTAADRIALVGMRRVRLDSARGSSTTLFARRADCGFAGRLLDDVGRPLAGVELTVFASQADGVPSSGEWSARLTRVRTGADGTFSIAEVPDVTLALRARAPGLRAELAGVSGSLGWPTELAMRVVPFAKASDKASGADRRGGTGAPRLVFEPSSRL